MLCPNCGTIMNNEEKKCTYCGYLYTGKQLPGAVEKSDSDEDILYSLKQVHKLLRQIEEIQAKNDEIARKRQKMEEKKKEILEDDMPGVFVVIGILGVIIIIGLADEIFGGFFGGIISIVIFLVVMFLIYTAYSYITENSRIEDADEYYNSAIKSLEKEENEHYEKVDSFKKSTDIEGTLEVLPEKYRSCEIVEELIQLFHERRVDSLKEALNLYEDHAHKRRMEEMQEIQLREMESRQQCPSCGGRNCTLMTETTTKKDEYSAVDGCCGYLLMGPIGLLCGACGMGGKTKTKTYWMCQNCGNKFNA